MKFLIFFDEIEIIKLIKEYNYDYDQIVNWLENSLFED